MPASAAALRDKAAQCRRLAQTGTRRGLPLRRRDYLVELAERLDREARGIERLQAAAQA